MIKYARNMEMLKALIVSEGINVFEPMTDVLFAVQDAGIEPWLDAVANITRAIRELRMEQWDASEAAFVAEAAEEILKSINPD